MRCGWTNTLLLALVAVFVTQTTSLTENAKQYADKEKLMFCDANTSESKGELVCERNDIKTEEQCKR